MVVTSLKERVFFFFGQIKIYILAGRGIGWFHEGKKAESCSTNVSSSGGRKLRMSSKITKGRTLRVDLWGGEKLTVQCALINIYPRFPSILSSSPFSSTVSFSRIHIFIKMFRSFNIQIYYDRFLRSQDFNSLHVEYHLVRFVI